MAQKTGLSDGHGNNVGLDSAISGRRVHFQGETGIEGEPKPTATTSQSTFCSRAILHQPPLHSFEILLGSILDCDTEQMSTRCVVRPQPLPR